MKCKRLTLLVLGLLLPIALTDKCPELNDGPELSKSQFTMREGARFTITPKQWKR